MKWTRPLPILALSLCPACAPGNGDAPGAARLVHEDRVLMGTQFGIQVVGDDESAARAAIEAAFEEVERIEALLSEWRETSEISAVNRGAGGDPVAVGPELLEVVERSIGASELTGGAFDITFAGCGRLWSFREPRVPDPAELIACLPWVDFRKIEVDPKRSTVRLPAPEMRIGIAGIGKGWGVDRAAAVLERHGIARYLVDGGGDIRVMGSNVGRPWSVGIAHPRQGGLYGSIDLDRGAVVTSGDYMSFFERDGVRYHHILDPATGGPARGVQAVTVLAPEATEGDALATGLFVLGPDRGLALVERLDGVEALFFDADSAVRTSSGFPVPR